LAETKRARTRVVAATETARTRDQKIASEKLQALQEQVEALHQEKEQVAAELKEKNKRDLAANDAANQIQARNLREASQSTEKVDKLESRLADIANELQDQKLTSHAEKVAIQQAASANQDAFSQQIATMKASLVQKQEEATTQANEKAQELLEKKLESERKVTQLQKDYSKAVQDWEHELAQQQEIRALDQAEAAKQMETRYRSLDKSNNKKRRSYS
jgi:hypothetical protein